MRNNYISDNLENVLLDVAAENKSLIEIDVKGNRISKATIKKLIE